MEKSSYLFINDRGRSIRISRVSLVISLVVILLLIVATIFSLYSVASFKDSNNVLSDKLKSKDSEISTYVESQKGFEGTISKVESELGSIKKNFETYKVEVQKNVH